ncbi:MAG: glutamine--fructose-6-phosphate transaminase (isomerizing) [Candidatus Merdivicinus sp.]|jgi:glucosamine--fructose-6-phosphate aminotransferase (isomerizing)
MCGIIGYSGNKPACPLLTGGLAALEYRGYDSAGVALWENQNIEIVRRKGRLEALESALEGKFLQSRCGIGHTRWATHGEPEERNAHPHRQGKVTLVHNGIIENYREIGEEMARKGYQFASDTDTETAAALLDSLYEGDPLQAIHAAIARLEGSYAFGILFEDRPDCIYAVRKGSPLVAAVCPDGCLIASDLTPLLPYTNRYILPEEGEILALECGQLHVYRQDLMPAEPVFRQADWTPEQAQKGGYRFFMEKEIHEQPEALLRTILPRVHNGVPDFSEEGIPDGFFGKIRKIRIAACGTAYYCGMVGKALIEKLARLPVEVEIASELRYRDPILEEGEAAVVISQSGETADTLAAMRLLQQRGIPVIAVVNTPGSSIAREADYAVLTHAGPEIAVASTKAYSVQTAVMYLFAIRAAMERGIIDGEEAASLSEKLVETANRTQEVLAMKEEIRAYSKTLLQTEHLFYIGRGLDYSMALEGSLKLKEISYIHSEAYAAGELKHGTLALVTPDTPVIALITQPELAAKTISNLREAAARGCPSLLIAPEFVEYEGAQRIVLPGDGGFFAPLYLVIVLQLISFYAAEERGYDLDKPRNLAKSVTVE